MKKEFKIKEICCKESDLKKIGFDKSYIKKGLEKHIFKTIKIYNLSCAQANIIKQTALSSGTDCSVHRETITGKIESSDCILSGTVSQFQKIIEKLKFQPLKLSILSETIKNLLFEEQNKQLIVRNSLINWKERTYIMGILNVTPDSFSDGGEFLDVDSALRHYKKLVADGADFIDIGGESTRPFSKKITIDEEINRILPVIYEIRKFDTKTIISIDTRNAKTADEAIKAGADIVNDVSSGDWDENMFEVVKRYNCPIILNHSKGSPDIMQNNTSYNDIIDDIYNYFSDKINELLSLGIDFSNIIIDPGLGFGKNTEQNFELLNRITEFKSLKCPILAGHSRKNFLRETINAESNDELDIATCAVSSELIDKKVNIIRVHNVKANKIVLDIKNKENKLFV